MGQKSFSTKEEKLLEALVHMGSALHLLDDADAPADIGAHVDLAICRLRDELPQCGDGNEQIFITDAPLRRG